MFAYVWVSRVAHGRTLIRILQFHGILVNLNFLFHQETQIATRFVCEKKTRWFTQQLPGTPGPRCNHLVCWSMPAGVSFFPAKRSDCYCYCIHVGFYHYCCGSWWCSPSVLPLEGRSRLRRHQCSLWEVESNSQDNFNFGQLEFFGRSSFQNNSMTVSMCH